ncbi:MAG: 2-C-methyl-D-erythritol 2,4-cyclodiphosphate synthase [Dehalococcoidales bacterium]|nr:2-C-methyl-D-erythritol 2,4-cyclodiphosphate synthase [Dehalococcoidales bacterium]
MRVGIGYDVHPFAEERRLVLGGVVVPFERGLTGWSDADVLTHAIIDALLGAASLGDIGGHFPPGDMEYKDISSLVLLERVREELVKNGWQIGNIDATIVAEQPMLGSFVGEMRLKLSNTLGIAVGRLSIKASSSAGLGFVGNGEGIEAQAVALIEAI